MRDSWCGLLDYDIYSLRGVSAGPCLLLVCLFVVFTVWPRPFDRFYLVRSVVLPTSADRDSGLATSARYSLSCLRRIVSGASGPADVAVVQSFVYTSYSLWQLMLGRGRRGTVFSVYDI